ncbi:glycosyltransferase family 2 protein [Pedobacter boryungensis]|uniref:Glycosyltransferase family 2 protein n=1 Tax=Pedobacter boryungensis TaxID=869962 RepID=A0ABX2DFC5_9SPHI|nr:glycosyltransferase family 2 protein [Pedobacter boryungensis]NQX32750.1 glycosyltransferase family 2 protein [Pedobacter boryungensis]
MGNQLIQVSIIIVNFNSTQLLIQCLESITKHTTCSYEIIVIDNNSTVDKPINLVEIYHNIHFIFNSDNLGFARANNQGISVAKGDYFFILNPDTYLKSDAIGAFLSFMECKENVNVACCGASLCLPDGKLQVAYGNFPTLKEAFSSLGFYRLYQAYYYKRLHSAIKASTKKTITVDYISGADLFLRKAALMETGLFDEDFFLYFEETELCFRFKKHEYKCVLLPLVEIVHLEGGSQQLKSNYLLKYQFFAKGRSLFFRKCYGLISYKTMKVLWTVHYLMTYAIMRRKYALQLAKITWKT